MNIDHISCSQYRDDFSEFRGVKKYDQTLSRVFDTHPDQETNPTHWDQSSKC